MNINPILDTAISLIFIYLLFSILVSSLSELISQILNKRGKQLKEAINEVFNDSGINKDFTSLFYAHPMIDRMKETRKKLPSYISSKSFSATLVDVIGREYEAEQVEFVKDEITGKYVSGLREGIEEDALARFKAGLETMQYSDLKILLTQIQRDSANAAELHKNVESWFNDYMDRVSGWYKKKQQWKLFWLSLIVTVLLNVNTIDICKKIWTDDVIRQYTASSAIQYIQEHADSLPGDSTARAVYNSYNMLKEIPLGWNLDDENVWQSLTHPGSIKIITVSNVLGWLLTALALRFGAPFWFDILKKLVNIRGGGVNPAESRKN